jgi:hypothetical protein
VHIYSFIVLIFLYSLINVAYETRHQSKQINYKDFSSDDDDDEDDEYDSESDSEIESESEVDSSNENNNNTSSNKHNKKSKLPLTQEQEEFCRDTDEGLTNLIHETYYDDSDKSDLHTKLEKIYTEDRMNIYSQML